MKTSDSIANIAPALALAQGKIGGARKDAKNPHFNSRYADLASCWDACREALSANGISVVQMTDPSERDEIVLDTRLLHSSGEWIEGRMTLPVSKADAQGYGSALTYARRYGLCAAVGIAPEDDDGNAASAAAPPLRPAVPAEPPITDQEVSDALMLLAEEATEGMAAVQAAMEGLRPKLQAHLRKAKKAELASIKIAATKNEAAEPA